MSKRAMVVGLFLLGACTRATPDATPVVSDPAQQPMPAPTAPASAPSVSRVCEPPVSCGVWGKCAFFESIAGDRHRGPDGRVYRRAASCWPADAGAANCSRYCASPASCVDGLVAEDEVCAGASVPHPAPFRCEVRDGACVRASS